MTTPTAERPQNLEELSQFIDGLKPVEGRFGGRRFTYEKEDGKEGVIKFDDLVRKFQELAEKEPTRKKDLAERLTEKDFRSNREMKKRLTKIRQWFGKFWAKVRGFNREGVLREALGEDLANKYAVLKNICKLVEGDEFGEKLINVLDSYLHGESPGDINGDVVKDYLVKGKSRFGAPLHKERQIQMIKIANLLWEEGKKRSESEYWYGFAAKVAKAAGFVPGEGHQSFILKEDPVYQGLRDKMNPNLLEYLRSENL